VTLAEDLGYHVRRPNALQRLVQRLGASRPGAWVFSKSLRHLDDALGRLTSGGTSAPELLAGLPVLDLTTTGRRSGRRRTSHLIAVPVDGTLALLGTNFGQASTPSWVLNVESDPRVVVRYRQRSIDAVARPASDEEQARVLAGSAQVYGGYLKYQQRITERRLRVFLLQPVEERPDAEVTG
jgi:deazaflavin-dependent oxidoreductase (nitroreductase family)